MRNGMAALLVGCASAAGLVVSCAPAEEAPSVVLVSIDTLRADATSPYGGPVPTPTLARLAREGVLFERAFSPAPETAPSHATLFTGQQIPRHGVAKNGIPLRGDARTLAEALHEHGYATAAFVSSWVLDPRFSWDRGFESYDAVFPEDGDTMSKETPYPGAIWVGERFAGLDRRGGATVAAVAEWLGTAPKPFFLFVHLFDPHAPYVPPKRHIEPLADQPFDVRNRWVPGLTAEQIERRMRRYHGEVAYTDEMLGRLLTALESRTGTPPLVVIVSDHGEGLGQHGVMEHALHLYDEQLHVPLLFHWPGQLAVDRRIATPVGIVDVAPTVLDLLGLPPFPAADGRSMAASLRNGGEPEARPVFANRRSFSSGYPEPRGRQVAVRTDRWKYIQRQDSEDEFYDLLADPLERTNRIGDAAGASELRAILDRYEGRMPELAEPSTLSDEVRENLRALGYAE